MGEKGGPLDKRWARVCNGRWADRSTTAAVACRQLGYDSGKMYRHVFMTAAYFISVDTCTMKLLKHCIFILVLTTKL